MNFYDPTGRPQITVTLLGCGTRPAEGERQALLRVETRFRVIRILYLPLTRSWLQSGVSSKESSGASGS